MSIRVLICLQVLLTKPLLAIKMFNSEDFHVCSVEC